MKGKDIMCERIYDCQNELPNKVQLFPSSFYTAACPGVHHHPQLSVGTGPEEKLTITTRRTANQKRVNRHG
jgi:hypothetical protein